ncbi:hypothetical protein NX059_010223 [Plenodomus lindquistii]|nr:hypothetical protein NX059_010223 [Plenodomus lindquistii]
MIVYPFLYYIIKFITILLDTLISPILAVIALLQRMFPDPQERQKRRIYQQQRPDRVTAIVRPVALFSMAKW